MCSNELPIVGLINMATNNQARAEILLKAPYKVLFTEADQFLNACRKNDFEFGVDYLCTLIAAMSMNRTKNGNMNPEMAHSLLEMQTQMNQIAFSNGDDNG